MTYNLNVFKSTVLKWFKFPINLSYDMHVHASSSNLTRLNKFLK